MNKRLAQVFLYAGYFVFTVYLIFLATSMTRRASTYPVMLAESSDGANSLDALARTTWSSNNGWFAYGPFYYRLAYTLQKLDPIYRASGHSDTDVRDKAAHLSLMLVSLLAAAVLSYWIASLTSPTWLVGWVTASLLFCFLGASELWTDMSVDNHPDILMTFLMTLGVWTMVKAKSSANAKMSWWHMALSGALWGLALLSKPTAAIFIAAATLFMTLLAIWNKSGIKTLIVELGILGVSAAVAYFVSGYPQAFDFAGTFNFVKWISTSTVHTFEIQYWIDTLVLVGVSPLLVVLGSTLLSPNTKEGLPTQNLSPRAVILSFVVPLFAFTWLFPMAYQNHRRYYILPILGMLLMSTAITLRMSLRIFMGHFPHLTKKPWNMAAPILGLALIAGTLFDVRVRHLANTGERLYDRFSFQKEAEGIQNIINAYLNEGKNVIADPYVPIDSRKYAPPFSTNLSMKMLTDAIDANVLISSRWYYERFLEEKPGEWELLVMSEKQQHDSHLFYRAIDRADSFVDGRGRQWRLKKRTPLGWGVWESVPLVTSVAPSERQALENLKQQTRNDLLAEENKTQKNIALSEHALDLKQGTLAVWARSLNPRSGAGVLVDVNSTPGSPRAIYLDHNGVDGTFNLTFNGTRLDTGTVSIIGKGWRHYAITWEKGHQTFYVDGGAVATGSAALPTTGTRKIVVGALDTNAEQEFGEISGLQIFRRPLRKEEINSWYRLSRSTFKDLP